MNSNLKNDETFVDQEIEVSYENDKVWAERGFDFDEHRKQLAEYGTDKEKLRDEVITYTDPLWDEMF